MSGLDLERAMISPICLGISERALQLSLEYAQTRQQFGKPIANFQMIQSKLADMYVWVEAMRVFTYQALRATNDLEVGGGGRGDIHKISAASVMFAAETMNKVLNEAVQIHGGSGYIWESEVNRLYRAIKLLEIGAGTTEVRRNHHHQRGDAGVADVHGASVCRRRHKQPIAPPERHRHVARAMGLTGPLQHAGAALNIVPRAPPGPIAFLT